MITCCVRFVAEFGTNPTPKMIFLNGATGGVEHDTQPVENLRAELLADGSEVGASRIVEAGEPLADRWITTSRRSDRSGRR